MNRFDEFRGLHHAGRPLLLPGAWDVASAAALAAAGFRAVGTSSLAVATAAGMPDDGAATRDVTLALVGAMVRLPCLVSVDLEGGLSDRPEEVADLAERLVAMGVVGLNVEDGRPGGSLAPVEQLPRVIAAIKARTPGLFINARTDTFWRAAARTPSLPETIERLRAYEAAGADGVFAPFVSDEATIAALVEAVEAPLNVLFMPGHHTLGRLAELGVRRVSCGSLLFRVGLGAALRAAAAIQAGDPLSPDEIPSFATVQALAPPWSGAPGELPVRQPGRPLYSRHQR